MATQELRPIKYAPYDAPAGYLKRETFRLAAELIARGDTELARGYARLQDRRVADESADGPDLYRWLLAGLSDDELSRSEKRRYAHELHYARRHDVAPDFLVGFLYQVGAGPDIFRRAADPTVVEPWFRRQDERNL